MEQGVNFIVFGNAVLLLTQAANQGISQLKQAAERIAAETTAERANGKFV
jgi:hypothetical protein